MNLSQGELAWGREDLGVISIKMIKELIGDDVVSHKESTLEREGRTNKASQTDYWAGLLI